MRKSQRKDRRFSIILAKGTRTVRGRDCLEAHNVAEINHIIIFT